MSSSESPAPHKKPLTGDKTLPDHVRVSVVVPCLFWFSPQGLIHDNSHGSVLDFWFLKVYLCWLHFRRQKTKFTCCLRTVWSLSGKCLCANLWRLNSYPLIFFFKIFWSNHKLWKKQPFEELILLIPILLSTLATVFFLKKNLSSSFFLIASVHQKL